MNEPFPSKPPVTDSPWFWAMLFCAAGLVILVVAQGQVSQRQVRIERQTQGRQRAAEMAAGGEAVTAMSTLGDTQITIEPLLVLLIVGLVVASAMFLRGRRLEPQHPEERGLPDSRAASPSNEPAKGHASPTSKVAR